jgi:methionyl aminopeptidase
MRQLATMLLLKTPEEIEVMGEGGWRLGEVLKHLAEETRAGVTTKQLDRMAYQLIHKIGAKPAFLNYRPAGAVKPYPFTLCTSLNGVVVHGQPSEYVVKDGDLVKLDLGLVYKGFYLDAAVTVAVGKVSREAKKLMAATMEALNVGIEAAEIGNTLGDIGAAVQNVARKNKFSVADGLTGHGIGRALHEDPTVFNVGRAGEGETLREGMVLAIEPMIVAGKGALAQLRDESWATADGSLAAHFEHTVAITKRGPKVLTKI